MNPAFNPTFILPKTAPLTSVPLIPSVNPPANEQHVKPWANQLANALADPSQKNTLLKHPTPIVPLGTMSESKQLVRYNDLLKSLN